MRGCTCAVGAPLTSRRAAAERDTCGVCGGRLALLPRLRADGTPAAKRAPTAFSLFVKTHFAAAKAALPGAPHADVMRELSARWKSQQRESAENAEIAAGGGAEDELGGALRALDLSGDA